MAMITIFSHQLLKNADHSFFIIFLSPFLLFSDVLCQKEFTKKHLSSLQGQVSTCGTTLFDAARILSAECHHTLCPLRRLRVSATWRFPLPFTSPSEAHLLKLSSVRLSPPRIRWETAPQLYSLIFGFVFICINLTTLPGGLSILFFRWISL